MNHFLWMVSAEVRKVFSRLIAVLAVLAAASIPLGVTLLMYQLRDGGPTVNGAPVGNFITYSAVEVGSWTLNVRNFLVLPLFLALSTATAVAGELGDRTLREVLVRPVGRATVLAVRVVALSLLSLVSLVVSFAVAMAIGLAAFGLPAPPVVPEDYPGVLPLLGGYAATFLCDVGVIVLVTLVSLLIRSVGLSLVVLVLGWGADFLFRKVLGALASFGVESAAGLLPWTVGNALGAWEGWATGYEWPRFLVLLVGTVVVGALAVLRFRRLDVP